MKKDLQTLRRLLFCLIFLAATACEKGDPDCYQSNVVQARIQFVSKDSIMIDSILNDTLLLDTTIIRYADTAFEAPVFYTIDMERNLQIIPSFATRVGVPLDPRSDTIRYIFKLDSTADETDTLRFAYSASNHFISNNCGFTNFFQLRSVEASGQLVDSVAIINPEVTNSAQETHVQLFFFVD